MNANAMLGQFAKGAAKEAPRFTEITRDDVAGFQKIVALLTSFDERTGRHLRYNDQETHFARVALAKCREENVRFFIRDLGGYVYSVIGHIESNGTVLSTGWVHEDGIRQEREEYSADKDHPVHSIECLTDFFERATKHMKVVHVDHIPAGALALMERED